MAREGRGGVKGGRVVGFLGGQLCQKKINENVANAEGVSAKL
jgi:hypothetical protein